MNNAKHVAKLQLIEQQIAGNQLQLAAENLNALLKTHPKDPRVFLLGSVMARAAKNPNGELQLAQKAHLCAPHWPVGSLHLAKVLASLGLAEEALAMAELASLQAVDAPDQSEILIQSAAIAYQFGDNDKALKWLRLADKCTPGATATRYKIAVTLMASGDYTNALDVLTPLIAAQPDEPVLLSARVSAYLGVNQLAQAAQDAQSLLVLDPDNEEYKFFLAFARGENPGTLPATLTGQLFNSYASKFDRHLVVQLKYKLPRDVAQMIHAWHPDKKVDVLDLGCGTGLLGVCLGPQEGVLVGVDLSKEMIDQALRHGVYHRLHQVNLLDALKATPADLYHVITALDVLGYIGDLGTVMADALRILLPGGRFVFSCELGAEDGLDFTLQNTLRYTHRQGYIENLLQQAGFVDVTFEPLVLRQEPTGPVQGLLITACKPLQAPPKTVRKSTKKLPKATP